MSEVTPIQTDIADGKAAPVTAGFCCGTEQAWWSDKCPDCGDALIIHTSVQRWIRPDGSVVPELDLIDGADVQCWVRTCVVCEIRADVEVRDAARRAEVDEIIVAFNTISGPISGPILPERITETEPADTETSMP